MKNLKPASFALFFLILLLVLLPGCAGGGGGGASAPQPPPVDVLESELPLPPAAQPLNAGDPEGPPPPTPRDTQGCDLGVGWSTISFPFDSLTSTSGFTYYLYCWNGTQYQLVDPTNAPAINCSQAFWTYFGSATHIDAAGNYSGSITSVTLSQGWNLFAFPRRQNKQFPTITMTYNGETKLLKNASSYATTSGSSWAYARLYYYRNSVWTQLRCDNDSNELTTYYGYWIWSWHNGVVLNFTRTAVSSINPASGPIGIPVTILGAGFGTSQGTSTLTFNGVAAGSASSWCDTRIVCPVPVGAATGPVLVTSANGVSNSDIIFTLNPPQISGLSPNSGCGGTLVSISGSNFGTVQGTSTIRFNGVNAAPASYWSNTLIICRAPIAASTGPVVINTLSGQSNTNVSFTVPAPQISSLNPYSGVIGATVTVTGSDFAASQGTSTVSFNGVNASSVTSWCSTQIICQVPMGAASGAVVVTTAAGGSNTDVVFTLEGPPAFPPSVDTISPASGAVGSQVTVNGLNFGASKGSSTISFNAVNAGSVASWSNTRIICTVPAGATTGPVVATVGGQASNNDVDFTVTP